MEQPAWDHPNPFMQAIKVLPEHTDQLGHTNNVRYLEWLEAIAWQHIDSLQSGWAIMQAAGKAFAIVRTEMQYLAATYPDDELLLGTWITGSDNKFKCHREFQLIRQADNKTILRAEMDFVSISLKTGAPTRMSKEMQDAMVQGIAITQNK